MKIYHIVALCGFQLWSTHPIFYLDPLNFHFVYFVFILLIFEIFKSFPHNTSLNAHNSPHMGANTNKMNVYTAKSS